MNSERHRLYCARDIKTHMTLNFDINTKYVYLAQQPPVGQGPLIHEDSRSHSESPQSLGHLWTSDQPDAETSTWQHTTQ